MKKADCGCWNGTRVNQEPIFDKTFRPSSYGYPPKHLQHQAVAKAERFMNKYGLEYVVDMDLSKY